MMKIPISEAKPAPGSHFQSQIVSQFSIHDLSYFVIIFDASISEIDAVESLVQEDITPIFCQTGASQVQVVDTFTIYGKSCAIVQYQASTQGSEADLTSLLTARELQVATLVAQGLPNKKVAKKLHISEWTVATHLRRIFAKLNVDSRAAMVYRCANYIRSLDPQRPSPKIAEFTH